MFAQPWAWLGLVGLAVPIAIHLLARHSAVRTMFPTLRFIDLADVTFIKRQRLTDIPLLLVRLLLVAAAVAALAGPRWRANTGGATGPSARAIVVDTSAGAAGDAGLAAARAEAQSAATSAIVASASLPAGVESAVAWLARQSGRRELVIVSDFQRGAIDAAALAIVPDGVGIRFTSLSLFPLKTLAGYEPRGDRARMAWPVAPSGVPLPLTVRAGAEQARADAMLAAVASLIITAPVDATARRATIVFPSAPEFASASNTPIDQPFMFDVVEPLLRDASLRAHVAATSAGGALLLRVDADPGSVTAADITSSVLRSLLQPVPWREFESSTIAPETLRRWERAPTAAPLVNAGEPQGRWLWLVALALLGVETWMRRRAIAAREETAHARVA